jgi:type IV secretory pathway TrbD component
MLHRAAIPPPTTPRRRARAHPRSRCGDQRGQATVEVVALLPVIVVLLAAAWQAALAGHAFWAATTAARAAARAHAVGADARAAARSRLPGALERGLRVEAGSDGEVEVRVRIPPLPGLPSPGHARADARFEPQR